MIRFIARALGIVTSAYWAMALLGSIFSKELSTPESTIEGLVLCILVSATITGFLLSWRYLKFGALLMIVSSMALSTFAYFSAGRNKLLAVMVSGVPFLVSGLLLLLSVPSREK